PWEQTGRCQRNVDIDVEPDAQRRTPPSRGHESAPSQMTVALDPLFQSALDALAFPGVLIGHRLISPGDEHALLPEEAPASASSVIKVRRASGAARIAVRQLLARLGYPECPVPRAASGAPVWPGGVVGSLAHDARVAVAAVGKSRDIGALGIDVEPAQCLPPDLMDLIATPQERRGDGQDPFSGPPPFAPQEAVFQAGYSLHPNVLRHPHRHGQ